uniref:Uncharacterized protein n=1 Tax=Panagrolaimus davidi TaxID=227884 RepID=A0A914QHT2_9BILA
MQSPRKQEDALSSNFSYLTVSDNCKRKETLKTPDKPSSVTDLCSKLDSLNLGYRSEKKADLDKDVSSNSSTFSLHIAAYENSAVSQASKPVKPFKIQCIKDDGPFKFRCIEEVNGPEVMQFKPSMKLLKIVENPIPKTKYDKMKENANALFESKRYDDAAKAYGDILAFCETTPHEKSVIYSNRCAAFLQLLPQKHALRKAKKDAEKSIMLDPTWWRGYSRLASCHIEHGKWDEAKDCLLKAINLNADSEVLAHSLNFVDYQIIKSKLHYPQRISLSNILKESNILDKFGYCISPLFSNSFTANEDWSTETEVKRSGEFEDFYADLYGEPNDTFPSLISDRPNSSFNIDGDSFENESDFHQTIRKNGDSNGNSRSSVILDQSYLLDDENLETSPNNGLYANQQFEEVSGELETSESYDESSDLFTKIDKHDLTQCCKNVCNIECDTERILTKIPYGPPGTSEQNKFVKVQPGIYKCIIDGRFISNVNDISYDGLAPWNDISQNKTSHTDQIGLFKEGSGYKAVTKKKEGAEKIIKQKYSKHFQYPIARKIYSLTTTLDNVPTDGSNVVIIYVVSKEFTYVPSKQSRLLPSKAGEVAYELRTNTPKTVVSIVNRNAGFMGDSRPVTRKQVEAKARNDPTRKPVTKKGRPKFERSDVIEALLEEGYFVQARYKTPTDERIFLSNDTSLGLMIHSMLPKAVVLNFVRQVNYIKTLPKEQRLQELKKLIESKQYEDLSMSAVCSADSTFRLSRLLCMDGGTIGNPML